MTDEERDLREERIETLANQALSIGRELTTYVVLIGNNWYYGAVIKNHRLSQKDHAEIKSVTGNENFDSSKTIEEVLNLYYADYHSVTVVPVGAGRMNEARELYDKCKIAEKEELAFGELMEVQLKNRFVSLYLLKH